MPKGELKPVLVEVRCTCTKMVNVRSAQAIKTVACWDCRRIIEVRLYRGYGKVSVFITNPDGTGRVQLLHDRYEIVWQDR